MNREPIEFAVQQLRRIDAHEELARQFNMSFWANNTATHPLDEAESLECGFAGCFMGWAAHQQWFDQFGLKLRLARISHTALGNDATLKVEPSIHPDGEAFMWQAEAIEAVCTLFDVSEKVIDLITLPDKYEDLEYPSGIRAGDVADRLELLLLAEGSEEEFFYALGLDRNGEEPDNDVDDNDVNDQ
jgi:hypothetical protein